MFYIQDKNRPKIAVVAIVGTHAIWGNRHSRKSPPKKWHCRHDAVEALADTNHPNRGMVAAIQE